ncbi:MAG: ribosome recycling factor [Duodenibacillus sp.]|nr:ribosome recycling factor [Duodenibacillus sp.]
MTTIAEIQKQTEYKSQRTIESLRDEFKHLRTGRASTSLLDHVQVDYYGSAMPLSQVANLGLADARTITVTPWDRKMIKPIEKAILASDLGLNPIASGDGIRIPLPPLNEERRRELTKVVRGFGEDAKVAIRNLRRDANDQFKKMSKAKEISEDDESRAQKDIQKAIDRAVEEIDKVVAAKEKEVMTV